MTNSLVEKLRTLLKNNIVCFTYKKINGEIRVARGTRNLTIASALGYSVPSPKNGEQPYSYYDLDCEGWRSYRPENLLSIESVIPMSPLSPSILKVETKGVETPVEKTPVKETPLNGLFGGFDKGTPVGDKTGGTITSPQGEMTSIDQFARLVAKYVADEIISRITFK